MGLPAAKPRQRRRASSKEDRRSIRSDLVLRLEKYISDVRWRASLLALASVGLLVWTSAKLDGLGKEVLETIGTALLVAAAIDVLLEGRLRADLTETFIDAARTESGKVLAEVGLSTRLKESRIIDVFRRPPDWDAFLAGAQEVEFLPHRLVELDQEWASVLATASGRVMIVTVHLPSETSPNIAELAERLGADSSELPATLRDLARLVGDQWSQASPRRPGELHVSTYDRVPGFGFLRADHKLALVLPSLGGPRAAERFLTVVFDTEGDEVLSRWFTAQLHSIDTRELNVVPA